jgi:hypothetical protein
MSLVTYLRRRPSALVLVSLVLAVSALSACAGERGSRFTSVHAGAQHTCAIDTDNNAWCWGANRYGQLGDGTSIDRDRPVRVGGDHLFTLLDLGSTHTCGIDVVGEAWCWGGNFVGKLGNGTLDSSSAPVAVVGLPGPSDTITLSSDRSCAVVSGSLWCWGDNTQNVMGIDSRSTFPIATQIIPSGVLSHAMVAGKSCSATTVVLCVGIDVDGVQPADQFAGVPIEGLPTDQAIVEVAGAQFIFCGRSETGSLFCWGNLAWNIDADGTWTEGAWLKAIEIDGTKAERLTTMDATICHLENGQVICRGNLPGQAWVLAGTSVANAAKLGAPWVIPFPGERVVDISGGSAHICAVLTDGVIWCSGSNSHGQLGNGGREDSLEPVRIAA